MPDGLLERWCRALDTGALCFAHTGSGPPAGGAQDAARAGPHGMGFDGFTAIGAESLTLPPALLTTAVDRLLDPTIDGVIGPSADGGYYVIGLRAPAPALFSGIPWGTADVFTEHPRAAAGPAGGLV